MSPSFRRSLVQGLTAFLLLVSHARAGDKPLTVGIHKDLHGLDVVDIKEVFKRTDYAVVRISPFDLSPIEIPAAEDNTHGVVLEAKAKFHERFLAKVRAELAPMTVSGPEPPPVPMTQAVATPVGSAPGEAKGIPATEAPKMEAPGPRILLVKGVVTRLNPGSASARAFFGMFGGGQARVEITCEVIDAASGKVLATMIQARAGTMSGGWGYDRLVQNLCEEVAEDVATLIKQFN